MTFLNSISIRSKDAPDEWIATKDKALFRNRIHASNNRPTLLYLKQLKKQKSCLHQTAKEYFILSKNLCTNCLWYFWCKPFTFWIKLFPITIFPTNFILRLNNWHIFSTQWNGLVSFNLQKPEPLYEGYLFTHSNRRKTFHLTSRSICFRQILFKLMNANPICNIIATTNLNFCHPRFIYVYISFGCMLRRVALF